jgi:aquaporin Z
MVGVAAVGNISGGVFNPAVGLGPWIFDLFTGGGFAHIWLYILAPLAGGALAAWFYNFVYPAKK